MPLNNDFDVIIIGGGITGAGTARDCAMRGLKVLLVERHDIATGATVATTGFSIPEPDMPSRTANPPKNASGKTRFSVQ